MAQITSLEDIKDYLGVKGTGRDARLQLLSTGVDAFVCAQTNRDWQPIVRALDAYQGNNTDSLVLRHKPASLLTAVKVDTVVIDVTDDDQVVLDGAQAILYRTSGSVWPESKKFNILVSYTGGQLPPADLKMAALELAAWINQSSGGKREVATAGFKTSLYASAMKNLPQAADIIEFYTDHASRWMAAPLGHRAGPRFFPEGATNP